MLWLRYSRCWPKLPKIEDALAEQSVTISIVISSVIVQFRPRSPIIKYTQTRIVDVDQKRSHLFDILRRIWRRVPSAKQTSQLLRQQGVCPFGRGRGASMSPCVQPSFIFLCFGYCCCDWGLYTCLGVVSCSCASTANCRIIIYASLILLVLIYVRHISRVDVTARLPSLTLLDGMELKGCHYPDIHGPSHQQELLRAKRCKST